MPDARFTGIATIRTLAPIVVKGDRTGFAGKTADARLTLGEAAEAG